MSFFLGESCKCPGPISPPKSKDKVIRFYIKKIKPILGFPALQHDFLDNCKYLHPYNLILNFIFISVMQQYFFFNQYISQYNTRIHTHIYIYIYNINKLPLYYFSHCSVFFFFFTLMRFVYRNVVKLSSKVIHNANFIFFGYSIVFL